MLRSKQNISVQIFHTHCTQSLCCSHLAVNSGSQAQAGNIYKKSYSSCITGTEHRMISSANTCCYLWYNDITLMRAGIHGVNTLTLKESNPEEMMRQCKADRKCTSTSGAAVWCPSVAWPALPSSGCREKENVYKGRPQAVLIISRA